MKISIRGLQHHSFIMPELKERVILVPEPENRFDLNAIAIYNQNCQRMGYVPQENNTDPRFITCFNAGLPIDAYTHLISNNSININIIFHLKATAQ
jgi:HIRAN domain-containing protein